MSWEWSGGANGLRDHFIYSRIAKHKGRTFMAVRRSRGDDEVVVSVGTAGPSVRVYIDLSPDDARELAAALVAAANIEDPEAAAAAPAPRDDGGDR